MKNRFYILLIAIMFLGSCQQKSKTKVDDDKKVIYMKSGKLITELALNNIGQILKTEIQSAGIPGALKFCNVHASGILDSISGAYSASVKRTSIKLRNENNKPNEEEIEMLQFYANQLQAKNELAPVLKKAEGNKVIYYAPIIIPNAICLNCHGELNQTLLPENYKLIKQLYPNDKAIGYKVGDLRGLWAITFTE